MFKDSKNSRVQIIPGKMEGNNVKRRSRSSFSLTFFFHFFRRDDEFQTRSIIKNIQHTLSSVLHPSTFFFFFFLLLCIASLEVCVLQTYGKTKKGMMNEKSQNEFEAKSKSSARPNAQMNKIQFRNKQTGRKYIHFTAPR